MTNVIKPTLLPLACALGIAVFVAAMPSFVSASHDAEVTAPDGVFTTACVTVSKTVPVGQQVTFAAGHYGGEGEITYRWLGAVSGEGPFQRPTFTTPGSKLVTVVATDTEGNVATAGCPVVATRTGTAPTGPIVPAGPGVGGAPGDADEQDAPATPAPDGGEDVIDEDAAEDTEDDEEEGVDGGIDITTQDGTNVGRVVLWLLIVAIIVSLGVLFWQRYKEDEVASGEEKSKKKPQEKEKNTSEQPPAEAYEDLEKEQKDSTEDGGESIIIPPAR